MSKKPNKLLSLYRKLYYAIFLILTLSAIYVLFPKQGMFKYEFQKGKPWAEETLIAPFDFPILKPKEAVQAEKDSLLDNYIPYFVVNTEIAERQLTLLSKDLENTFLKYEYQIDSSNQASITSIILDLFTSLYQHGILENSKESYSSLSNKRELNIITNNISVLVSDTSIFSIKTAYESVNHLLNTNAQNDSIFLGILKLININEYLVANLFYDEKVNDTKLNELNESVSITRGVVQAGVRIISEGDIVNNDNYLILESYKQANERNRAYGGWLSTTIIGYLILFIVLMSILVLYLQNFNKKIFWKKRNFSMILTTVLATFMLARLVTEYDVINIYLLPLCILPIIIRTFLGARMAIFIHLITIFLISFMVQGSFEFVFIQTIAGTVAVISLSKLHRRGHLFISSLFVFLTYVVLYLSFEMIKEGSIKSINWEGLIWLAGNGMLILMAYPLIYVIEKIFGFISDVTLMELSDTNHPLLRELAETAPGTFQHSMQVANLSEEVILRTGGNPMLVRTGALYHDVGKIKSSQFFIENQSVGENPHNKLSKLKSAEKIISHVFDGVSLAKKYNIPDSIINFIKMHHGKSLVKYFYLKYKEENPDDTISEEDFKYPGPNPTSRETAVVMLADGVEAAARSLPEKNEETLGAIINQIIDAKVNNHELDDAPITFKDIKDIKAIFLEKLKNIYHLRIQYPSEKEK